VRFVACRMRLVKSVVLRVRVASAQTALFRR
jgi:hypothetical protein